MLAGVTYIWLAQCLAFLLMPRSIDLGVRLRALVFWAIAAPVVLIVQPPMTALIVVAALVLAFSPMAPASRAAFFIVAVPAVPVFLSAPLPFPGINYLTDLTHYKVASVIILLPVLFAARDSSDKVAPGVPLAAVMLIAYSVYSALLIFESSGFTGGLRYGLDQILFLVIPFFAILATLRKPQDVDRFYQAVLIASLLLATVAIVSSFKRWDIYASSASIISETRDGVFRINATAGTHSLAFHLACGILVIEYLRRRIRIGWQSVNIMRIVLLAGMMTTDSRGGLGGLAVALCVYALLVLRSNALRALLFAALVGGAIWLAQDNVNVYDPHGTFSYRQDLFWTSLDYIAQYPLFGDRLFLQSGHFDHLLQGQGIIDITNMFLQVTLTFGLLGLALFASVFVVPFVKTGLIVLRMRRSQPDVGVDLKSAMASEDDIWFHAAAVTAAIGAGWLFLIATTSNVGLTMHEGIIFVAICCSLRRLQPVATAQSAVGQKRRGHATLTPAA